MIHRINYFSWIIFLLGWGLIASFWFDFDSLAAPSNYSLPSEIELRDELGNNILLGSTVSFGTTMTGSPLTKTFTISNSGTTDLSLAGPGPGPTVSGSGFTATAFGATTVPPGSSTQFQVTLLATSAAPFTATVSFDTNDSDETNFSFVVTGTVKTALYLPFATKPAGVISPGIWSSQTSGTSQTLRDVDCPSTTHCVAVGDAGTILVTTNGGNSWGPAASVASSKNLHGVSCASTTICVAVGLDGTILRSTNGGQNWTAPTSPTSDILRGIDCPSATKCLAAGGNGETISRVVSTDNGGTTWSDPVPGLGNTSLWGVSCLNDQRCFAVGNFGRIFTFNGASLGPKFTLLPNLAGVSCGSATICVAVGAAGTIFATSDSGASWPQQASPDNVNNFNGISCSSATTCHIVGSNGVILRSSGSVSGWIIETSNTTANLLGASCPADNICFAVGDGGVIQVKK